VQELLQDKPLAPQLEAALSLPRNAAAHDRQRQRQDARAMADIQLWSCDLRAMAAELNATSAKTEIETCKPFFARIEETPLTSEQEQAVVRFDNRVLVVAAAGSGKTATLVARAAYALHRRQMAPERILMLAFNTRAARLLKERLAQRCTSLGIVADRVVVRTFHAFGMDIIAQATGKKPRLAAWLEQGGDLARLGEMVAGLKRRDPVFAYRWDLFRMVFDETLPSWDAGSPDVALSAADTGYLTLQGQLTDTAEDRIIADWLFHQGVAQADLGDDGWRLCFSPQKVRSGAAFDELATYCKNRQIVLIPGLMRPAYGRKPLHPEQLLRLMRSFMIHAKGNGLSPAAIRSRIAAQPARPFPYRDALFLQLFETIRDTWERCLKDEGTIDYEDMLGLAAGHLECARWTSPFELVMVDEFQDASCVRARMVRALVQPPGRCLFAVGDDWQSINRFAGADISVMTRFEEWFGKGQILRLQRTFRCPPSLCTVSSRFVQKNPAQLSKDVESSQGEQMPTIKVTLIARATAVTDALTAHLARLHKSAQAKPQRRLSVLVLGRYRRDGDFMSPRWDDRFGDRLDISFMTVHSAKGAEADYVVLPRVAQGAFSFPSGKEDDELLQLAMPAAETYPHAEERRLFYVALTRARRAVNVLTLENRLSAFVVELVADHQVPVFDAAGEPLATAACPACRQGLLTPKTRKRDGVQFWACSRYPQCEKTARQC
jgi:DNA helicase-4